MTFLDNLDKETDLQTITSTFNDAGTTVSTDAKSDATQISEGKTPKSFIKPSLNTPSPAPGQVPKPVANSSLYGFDFSKNVPKSACEHVSCPAIGDNAGMGAVSTMQGATEYMANVLIKGSDTVGNSLQIGSSFFVPSGTCDTKTSDRECAGKTRYMTFNSVPTGMLPCENPTMPIDYYNQDQTAKGLLSGSMEDVVKINPFEFGANLIGQGKLVNNTCVKTPFTIGETIPYKNTPKEEIFICTSPLDTLVCGTPNGTKNTCTPLPALPAMKPFNTLIQTLINNTAEMFRKEFSSSIGPDTFPIVQDISSTSDLPILEPADKAWGSLCQTVERYFNMQAVLYFVENGLVDDQNDLSVIFGGRCLVGKRACVIMNNNGPFNTAGWYQYEWMSLMQFSNPNFNPPPNGVGKNPNFHSCGAHPTPELCTSGLSKPFCSWNSTINQCKYRPSVAQINWVGYINENDTSKILVDPKLFDNGTSKGIGNGTTTLDEMDVLAYAAVTNATEGSTVTYTGSSGGMAGAGDDEGFANRVPSAPSISSSSSSIPTDSWWNTWGAFTVMAVVVMVLVVVVIVRCVQSGCRVGAE